MRLVALGASNKEIARDGLTRSVDTIKTQLQRLAGHYGLEGDRVTRLLIVCAAIRAGDVLVPRREWVGVAPTAREREVLQALAKHGDYESAGEALGIAMVSVKSHLRAIARKAGTGRAVVLVVRAIRAGLIEP